MMQGASPNGTNEGIINMREDISQERNIITSCSSVVDGIGGVAVDPTSLHTSGFAHDLSSSLSSYLVFPIILPSILHENNMDPFVGEDVHPLIFEATPFTILQQQITMAKLMATNIFFSFRFKRNVQNWKDVNVLREVYMLLLAARLWRRGCSMTCIIQ
jgi:hypothetical protein